MAEFFYEGSVLPDAIPLTLDYQPKLVRRETETGPDAEFEIQVFVGRVRVRVTTELLTDDIVHALFIPAWDLARTLVEAAGFIRAIPYSVTLERAVLPDGRVAPFTLGDRTLAATHEFGDDDLERLADVFLLDLHASLALSDLLMALGKSHYSPIACGRVADGIAHLMTPEGDRKHAWTVLQANLRVEKAFVKLLSDVSAPSRHGDRQMVDAATTREIARRAWILMDRYLRFRLDGPLDENRFPVLTG